MSNSQTVYVVHCIDTEGPLYESVSATFERINKILGIKLDPSFETIIKLRHKQINLDGKEDFVAGLVSEETLNYKETWDQLDLMLKEMLSTKYRMLHQDPSGSGWVYNWFTVDHVGYDVNPRRRDIGYHNIFDHYANLLKQFNCYMDEIHWHFHPMSTYKEAHMCATSFIRSPHLIEGLCRLIIDRCWFPTCFRAGFHTERPDGNWFLEQWIPFDFSNQGIDSDSKDNFQRDVGGGRFGDWRRAPANWDWYHPSHDDYQLPGYCNRYIFRCLNIGTRIRVLTQEEVDKAFHRASLGNPTILAFTNHDFRDMRNDVDKVYGMIQKASKSYSSVKWVHSGALDAIKKVLNFGDDEDFHLNAQFIHEEDAVRMIVTASTPTFGGQPFLAVKTKDKRYIWDNFDFQEPRKCWSYTFDEQTIPWEAVDTIGLASNSQSGKVFVSCYRNGKLYNKRTW